MSSERRQFLKQSAAVAAASLLSAARPLHAAIRATPWRNWSGAQSCLPAQRVAPASEAELADLLRGTRGGIRAVGAGHSFSPLVPTDGTLVTLANMRGLVAHDAANRQTTFLAGTPISAMGPVLERLGLALPNMADIDYQTLGGALATSTHGTGIAHGSYSTQVAGLRLVTAGGEVIDCDAHRHPEVFSAARCSLGALGILSQVRLQNRPAFLLHRREWVQDTRELIEALPQLVRENQHFELNTLLHSDVSLASATNEAKPGSKLIPKETGGDADKIALLRQVHSLFRDHPRSHAGTINFVARNLVPFPESLDASYKIFANVRDVRFNEMEYEVPAVVGPRCLREVLDKIRRERLDSYFPVEFRYVRGDDIMLSMFQGRDSCAISVHQHYTMAYQDFFAAIEPIFWKYDGRPHWGKLHSLNARQLKTLYPRWQEFLAIREVLDPEGKFLNAHLRSLFGIGA